MSEAWAQVRQGRMRLFGGAAAVALIATAAHDDAQAQTTPDGQGGGQSVSAAQPAAPGAATRGPDGLPPGGAYLESDSLEQDREAGVWIARGSVESRYEGRVVRADEVRYNPTTGVVNARGNVALINADGSVQYAEETTLDDELRAGVALGFATRLPGNISIAAASAVRRGEELAELNNAIYTACNVCASDGETPRRPTWSVQAQRVTQDRANQIVVYRNAVFRVKDIPVFYAPVFWHPDPQAVRKSGFLVPEIEVSDRRGFSYEQPYVWVISPSQDLVVSPQVNSKVNPLLNFEHRKRFWSGAMETRFGYTYEQDFNGDDEFGETTSRSYVLGRGAFDINEDWRWGYTLERTSDDLFFDKYDVGDVYQQRGLYQPDDRRLLSQVHVERQTRLSYASMALLSFQDLRAPGSETPNEQIPLVAPLTELRWEPSSPVAGGRLRLRGGAAVLERDFGPDSRRVTGELDWRRAFTFSSGVRVEPFTLVRGDAYSLAGERLAPTDLWEPGELTRGYATVGADISYPLIRPLGSGALLLEPLLQLAVSNESDGSEDVPNEDSLSFEFDETTLFEPNKFPGFDRFEGGARLNAGVRATATWGRGLNASLLVGRSFRADDDDVFPARTGLREQASDWIVAATARPIEAINLRSRARLDSDTLEVRRMENNVSFFMPGYFFAVNHLKDVDDIRGQQRNELDAVGEVRVVRRLSLIGAASVDLTTDTWRRGEFGIRYQDECTVLDIVYERENTFNRTLGPSDSIRVRLTLATLGDVQER
jgi:LPS-assembly protein